MGLLVKLFELFATFFKIGLFTFGGGYAMLPMMQEEVLARGWATEEEIINFIAVSESTPGPFALNMSTYVGAETGGAAGGMVGSILGSVFATLGVVLPSFIIILAVAKFFEKFKSNRIVTGCMSGLKPAVIGLIASAVLSVGQTVFFESGFSFSALKDVSFYISAAIFAVMSVLSFKKVHPIIIICCSAAVGIIAGYGFNLSV